MTEIKELPIFGILVFLQRILMVGGGVLAAYSSWLTGSYMFDGLVADGVTADDLVLAVGSGFACFALLLSYHYLGTHVLPALPRGTRILPVVGFFLMTLLVIILSTGSNFLKVTEAPVRVAEQQKILQSTQDAYHASAKAAREIDALIPVVRAASETTTGLFSDEDKKGAVCNRGVGIGRCAAELKALATQLASTEATLIDAGAITTRLTRRAEDILSDIQRLRANADYSWMVRDEMIRRRIEDLGRITDEINQVLPVSAVESVVDAFQKPWRQIGFSPEGAAKMAGTFSPLASRLSENTVELRAVRHRVVTDTHVRTGLKAAIAHMDKVGVQAALAVMIDVLPLVAILILLVVQWGQDDRLARQVTDDGEALVYPTKASQKIQSTRNGEDRSSIDPPHTPR